METSPETRFAVITAVTDFLVSAEALLQDESVRLMAANHLEAIEDLRKLEDYQDLPYYQEICQAGIQAYMHLHRWQPSVFKFTQEQIFSHFIQFPSRGISNLYTLYEKGYAFV